ncbi:MAG: acyl-CoA/acyl-ACP dehydrogenase [Actinomycetota bacterium]|nr:acyl-CoA/acyl-ACP dehydrogenase [Actinomycetota bacterium]
MTRTGSLVAEAAAIAGAVAGPAADDVDRESRFPKEAIDALREASLLSAMIPARFGGREATLSEVGAVVAALARSCASTAMIFAMHQIQVACLVRHSHTPFFDDYLRDEVVGRQALLASATTEVGIGGDVRRSTCAVESANGRIHLRKHAPVISFGHNADAVLVTARRRPDSASSDQVLVLCRRPGLRLEPASEWNALGMRGTCSRGYVLESDDVEDCVLPDSFADISSHTMLPTSHLLWGHVWLGIAQQAASHAHTLVRAEARKAVGSMPPSAIRLAELRSTLLTLESVVSLATRRYDAQELHGEQLGSLAFAIDANCVKVAASTLVVDIVSRAMRICGMAGYLEDSEHRLGRLLRDAHSAELMVGNDRILASTAQLLLAARDQ